MYIVQSASGSIIQDHLHFFMSLMIYQNLIEISVKSFKIFDFLKQRSQFFFSSFGGGGGVKSKFCISLLAGIPKFVFKFFFFFLMPRYTAEIGWAGRHFSITLKNSKRAKIFQNLYTSTVRKRLSQRQYNEIHFDQQVITLSHGCHL